MQEIKYADAGMDMKKLALCFMRKSWLALAAAVAGALIGGIIYTVAGIVPEEKREYQAFVKVYLDFAPDKTGEVYQAYNGYTWNDLMATEPILDTTMDFLPEDYTREEVVAATKAEILSDVRLLTVTVTAHDSGRCNTILQATGQSLVNLGNTAKEFEQIEVIQTAQAKLVVADSRMAQAVLVGLVIAVGLMLLSMMLFYVLDDRILVASDLKQVTDMSFIGYAGAGGRLGRDYENHLAYLREQIGSISIFDVIQIGQEGQSGAAVREEAGMRKEAAEQEIWQKLRAADGIVLVAEYGKVHASYFAYAIDQCSAMGCRLVGVAISGADEKFLGRYYGRAVGRKADAH